MNDSSHPELTFNLPPIKLSGKSSVKELAVTVHVTVDESNRVFEYLNEMVMEQFRKEEAEKSKK